MTTTVLGKINPSDMGRTLTHEHLQFGFPGWIADITLGKTDYEKTVPYLTSEIEKAKAHGIKTIVDATPNECARDVQLMKMVSESAGVNIIAATGYYFEDFSSPQYWKRHESFGIDIQKELEEMFLKEICEGIAGTGIKAGVIKVSSGQGCITDFESKLMKAAAAASKKTGTPIATHTTGGTMGVEQAKLLINSGADPEKIQIGHMCRCRDISVHEELLSLGVFDAFDQIGEENNGGTPADTERAELFMRLLDKGYEKQLLISHDYVAIDAGRDINAVKKQAPVYKNMGFDVLFKTFAACLKEGGAGEEIMQQILADNASRLYS